MTQLKNVSGIESNWIIWQFDSIYGGRFEVLHGSIQWRHVILYHQSGTKTIMKYTFKRIICEECSAGDCSFSIYIFFSSLQLLILDMLTLHIKVYHYVFFHPFVCILHLPSLSLSFILFPITLFLLTYFCIIHVPQLICIQLVTFTLWFVYL